MLPKGNLTDNIDVREPHNSAARYSDARDGRIRVDPVGQLDRGVGLAEVLRRMLEGSCAEPCAIDVIS